MSAQPYRLPQGGRIDRSRPLRFTFNDRSYDGYHGDTLASALLANGVTLVGRSFKYHRPRGIMTAGAEEPNALVQLGGGARTEPNIRATVADVLGLPAPPGSGRSLVRSAAANERLIRFEDWRGEHGVVLPDGELCKWSHEQPDLLWVHARGAWREPDAEQRRRCTTARAGTLPGSACRHRSGPGGAMRAMISPKAKNMLVCQRRF